MNKFNNLNELYNYMVDGNTFVSMYSNKIFVDVKYAFVCVERTHLEQINDNLLLFRTNPIKYFEWMYNGL